MNGQYKVLIIDDEPHLREEIAEFLEAKGWQVVTAENGEEGLSLLERHKPDIVLCDVSMPVLNGHQTLTAIRARTDDLRNIPFVFLTAYGSAEAELKGRDFGADDYIPKSVELQILDSRLRSRTSQLVRIKSEMSDKIEDALQRHKRSASVRTSMIRSLSLRIGPDLEELEGATSLLSTMMAGVADPGVAKLLADAQEKVRRISQAVRDAQILSAIPGPSDGAAAERVSSDDLIDDAIRSIAPKAQPSALSIRKEGPAADAMVKPDFVKIGLCGALLWIADAAPGSEAKIEARPLEKGLEIRISIELGFGDAGLLEEAWKKSASDLPGEKAESANPSSIAAAAAVDATEAHGGSVTIQTGKIAIITLSFPS